MTRIAGAACDPDSYSKRWDRFIWSACANDVELARFIQRFAGYSITGRTDEEVLLFLHGPGATGKTTFVEALKAAAGEYAATAAFDTFTQRRGDAGSRSDIARLAGSRIVIASEVEEGKRLAEGLVKQVTGGDKVTARYLYRAEFEYRPQFKLWLSANSRPRVNADDEGIWRRIIQVPFTEVVPKDDRDPDLKRRLCDDPDESSAVLAWAVQGALEWRKHGLRPPRRVRRYTAEYRRENDPLDEFVADRCDLVPAADVTVSDLRRSYEDWCAANGQRPVGRRTLNAALEARGLGRGRRPQGGPRTWIGIALRPESAAS